MQEQNAENSRVTKEDLEEIAANYHGNSEPDIHIENTLQEYEVKWLLSQLKGLETVIDLGFGDGLISPHIAAHHRLTVLEGSSLLAENARKVLPNNAEVITTMFEDYNPSEKVDAVIASHILEHVENPRELLGIIRGWLKPGGILLAVVPNSWSLHRRTALSMGLISKLDELSPRDHKVGHLRVYNPIEFTDDITSVGFEIINEAGFFVKPLSNKQMIDWPSELLHALNDIAKDLPYEISANIGIAGKLPL